MNKEGVTSQFNPDYLNHSSESQTQSAITQKVSDAPSLHRKTVYTLKLWSLKAEPESWSVNGDKCLQLWVIFDSFVCVFSS